MVVGNRVIHVDVLAQHIDPNQQAQTVIPDQAFADNAAAIQDLMGRADNAVIMTFGPNDE